MLYYYYFVDLLTDFCWEVCDLCQARSTFFFNFLGIVRGNSEVEIKVTFAPMDFSTAHMKLQVRLLNG